MGNEKRKVESGRRSQISFVAYNSNFSKNVQIIWW